MTVIRHVDSSGMLYSYAGSLNSFLDLRLYYVQLEVLSRFHEISLSLSLIVWVWRPTMRLYSSTRLSYLFAVPFWSYNLHVSVQKCVISSPTAIWNYGGQCRGPGTRHTAATCDRDCFVNVQTFKVSTRGYLWGQKKKKEIWRTYSVPAEHYKKFLED